MEYSNNKEYALRLDQEDPLRSYRDKFHHPVQSNGQPYIYMCGNSLGLQPKAVREYVEQELKDWENLGVEGHFHAKNPWMPYHEFLTENMAKIVGGKASEVVVMNTLTVNLHLMMVSFYRPTTERYKIIMEYSAFPSDQYAVQSQVSFHGFDPKESIIELKPREGESLLRTEDILEVIEQEGDAVALVMLGGVNYYTGQFFELDKITEKGHEKGCMVGFDLAHAVGNVKLKLHEWNIDFAVWCTYKYLNSGPGSIAGCFVHENHAERDDLPRFAGWWGHDKDTRFLMGPDFNPIKGAEGWQLSNPPILPLAALRASLDLFGEVGIDALVEKSRKLVAYLEYSLSELNNERIEVISPKVEKERGCQISIRVIDTDKSLFEAISEKGVIADWREPDVIRIAPVPFYNSFSDIYEFVQILKSVL
ncbi:kynureninase [Sediminitomix flava]|uniref:Kynureninase n=1 Tax=Sediminitomix flava TaxID=379075 RepID=A0A315Z974_SEDFL|nr:kynureninase [Sediminitomix flava]PWJ42115.1 kynureninase [Sediminitomix flava]